MKIKVLILFFVMICAGASAQLESVVADSSNIEHARTDIRNVTDSVIDALYGAVIKVIGMIDWALYLILIFCASLFNEAVEAENWAQWLSLLKKLPRGMRSFIIGFLFIIAIAWTYRIKDRVQISQMFLTVFFAMGTMSIGINKIIRFVAERFGLRFIK